MYDGGGSRFPCRGLLPCGHAGQAPPVAPFSPVCPNDQDAQRVSEAAAPLTKKIEEMLLLLLLLLLYWWPKVTNGETSPQVPGALVALDRGALPLRCSLALGACCASPIKPSKGCCVRAKHPTDAKALKKSTINFRPRNARLAVRVPRDHQRGRGPLTLGAASCPCVASLLIVLWRCSCRRLLAIS